MRRSVSWFLGFGGVFLHYYGQEFSGISACLESCHV